MLISSEFRDYYDSIKTFGIDKSVVYRRKTLVVEKKAYERNEALGVIPELPYQRRLGFNFNVKSFIIGFCGKTYPAVELTYSLCDEYGMQASKIIRFYDADTLLSFLANKKVEIKKKNGHLVEKPDLLIVLTASKSILTKIAKLYVKPSIIIKHRFSITTTPLN